MDQFFNDLMRGDPSAICLAAAAYFSIVGLFGGTVTYRIGQWPSVEGVLDRLAVVSARVSFDASDGQDFVAETAYRYAVDGTEFKGDRLSPWVIIASTNLAFLIKLQIRHVRFTNGNRLLVHFNPNNPAKSYLIVPGPVSTGVLFFGCQMIAGALIYAGI
jgi:hypothetical protein